jgi:SAM-dependent methyltransferase
MNELEATRFNPTRRFTDRVADYVRARPGYPAAMIDWLHREFKIDANWLVADVGAGTGISTKIFLDAEHRVIAVEPNAAMRAAAQEWLGANANFSAVDGSAEQTGLADRSVDLVSVAQAFHWFDHEKVRAEWRRILKPDRLAVIYWNSRRPTGSAFLEGYEKLLREFDKDYATIAATHPNNETMRQWFGAGFRGMKAFDNAQRLNFELLVARTLSSSHAPREGDPSHVPLKRALRALFDATHKEGFVNILYDTRVFVGSL